MNDCAKASDWKPEWFARSDWRACLYAEGPIYNRIRMLLQVTSTILTDDHFFGAWG